MFVAAGNFELGACDSRQFAAEMAGGSNAELREQIARIKELHVQLKNLQELIEERIKAANEKVNCVDKDIRAGSLR
ncbi:hypothetical protein LguiB_016040 [Lonicera macranthoides]